MIMLFFPMKVVMENSFGYCFMGNPFILWWKPSLMLIKMKEILWFVVKIMTWYGLGTWVITSMMRLNLPTLFTSSVCIKVCNATHLTQCAWELSDIWIAKWDSSINWKSVWRLTCLAWWSLICGCVYIRF